MSTKNLHTFTAVIEERDGRLRAQLDHPGDWQMYLNVNYKPGDKIFIYSKKYYKRRSTGTDPKTGEQTGNQNGYYWAVVLADIAAHTGHTPQEIHEEMKALHNPIASRFNSDRTVPGETSVLNTVEFEDYLERVRAWAQDVLELKIPLPNETPEGE